MTNNVNFFDTIDTNYKSSVLVANGQPRRVYGTEQAKIDYESRQRKIVWTARLTYSNLKLPPLTLSLGPKVETRQCCVGELSTSGDLSIQGIFTLLHNK